MTKTSHFPAEWAPHDAVWTAWPSDPNLWLDDLEPARLEAAAFFQAIADGGRGEQVKVLAHGEEAVASARAMLAGHNADVLDMAFGDIWLRDTGPLMTIDGDGSLVAHCPRFNGWGGKYVLDHDDSLSGRIAGQLGLPVQRHDWILEGGAVDVDGAGALLTTEQCLLNPNRNPDLDRKSVEERLTALYGAEKIVWLGEGLIGDHTDGHVDNLARFVAPGEAVTPIATTNDDPNRAVYDDAARRMADAGLTVHRIPSAGLVRNEDGDAVPASPMNFYIGNTVVVVPLYGGPADSDIVTALGRLFPGRRTIGLPARALLTGGGSFHCITQQQPQRRS